MAAFYRADGWVKSVQGQAIAGAQIYICIQPADFAFLPPMPLAAVFSDPTGLSPIVQPIITDGFGHFDYYAASGVSYTEVIVNNGKVQASYADQIPMGATLGPAIPPFPGDPTLFLNGTGVFSAPAGGTGTVTNTAGPLTINALIVGNGGSDEKSLSSLGTTVTVLHGNAAGVPTFGPVVESDISLSNNTTNNVSITAHGFAPVLPNDASKFLDGTGAYSTPPSSFTSVNPQTASYVATLSDANNIVTMNVGSANTFTIPTHASVAFPVGTTLTVIQLGTGQVTMTASGGVTMNNPSSVTTRVQYSTVSAMQVAIDTWVLAGDLT